MFLKKYHDILNAGHITPYHNHIIHVDNKNNTPIRSRFHLACRETTLMNEGVECDELSLGALFETIDSFAKTTHLDILCLHHIVRRLLHIDLIKITIEKALETSS